MSVHVDEFIDDWDSDPYASFFFMLHRLPATMQSKFGDIIKQYELYCTYGGRQYRVTGASRLGDVWLTLNFSQDTGYSLRVDIENCTGWSNISEATERKPVMELRVPEKEDTRYFANIRKSNLKSCQPWKRKKKGRGWCMFFTDSKWYFALVFTVVMPLNGYIISNGSPILGVALILMQLPWFLGRINN